MLSILFERSMLSICLLIFSLSFFTAHSSVPSSAQFKYVNEGGFGKYTSEYVPDYRPLDIFTSPFQLCFYNTTPNAYTLSLRMGTRTSRSLMRWVWEANRGNPVRENATLTFGADGNMVLADADGRIAWQTKTANKGVVGFQLLASGNMVLHNSKGKYIWQSFDSLTDTLLVGQSLRLGAVNKLVSRASTQVNANGPYSLVIESNTLAMYYKSSSSPSPLRYFSFINLVGLQDDMAQVTFDPDLSLSFKTVNPSLPGESLTLKTARYNSTLSYLRLGIDGNLRFFTYALGAENNAWETTYTLFSRDSGETECQVPDRCGNFGLCENEQCVGCPSPSGLKGWSKDCKPPKLSSCAATDITYYKLDGVDHFLCKYTRGDGPMKQDLCRNKCSKDCKCLGYFYDADFMRCWTVDDLKTLTKVANSNHTAYIKSPIK